MKYIKDRVSPLVLRPRGLHPSVLEAVSEVYQGHGVQYIKDMAMSPLSCVLEASIPAF